MTRSTPLTPPGAPPGLGLYYLAIGHYVSHALALAAKLGIADLIADKATSFEELAQRTETHAPSLRRVLRLLAAVGVLEEGQDGRFGLTSVGELLRDDVPGSMRAMVQLFAGEQLQSTWSDLEYSVRTGEPAFRKADPTADPFTHLKADPTAAATFDKAMATFAPQTAAAVVAAYDFSAFGRVVDIGGGNGALLGAIARATPALRGTVFDRPDVAERARAHLASLGVADRLDAAGGSFFESVPAGADAYLIKHVIHDWNDEQASAILRVVRAAMPPHAKLLIVEGVYPARVEHSLASHGAAANDVNMLVAVGGRQRSEHEFRELYASAGFELTRVVRTQAAVCVIEGVPRG